MNRLEAPQVKLRPEFSQVQSEVNRALAELFRLLKTPIPARRLASIEGTIREVPQENEIGLQADEYNKRLVAKINGEVWYANLNNGSQTAVATTYAPSNASFVTTSSESGLSAEKVITPTANQILITAGASTVVISFPTSTSLNHVWEDSGTSDMQNSLIIARNSSGTPAASFGSAIELRLETNTTANTRAAAIDVQHLVATHASRTARLRLLVADAGGDREGFRVDSDGSAARIAFFGGTAVVKQAQITQTYSTASATHANPTATTLTDNSGGTGNTTLQALTNPADSPADADTLRDDLVANLIPEVRNNFADLAASNNALIVDVANTKQVLNTVIDYLQAYTLTS